MPRLAILFGLWATAIVAGCSTRIQFDHEQTDESSVERSETVVEVSRLAPPPPVPAEPVSEPQPPVVNLEGNGVIVFGDVVETHHHLHFHEAPVPPSVLVDVRVQVDVVDDRDRRRRMVERRLSELRTR